MTNMMNNSHYLAEKLRDTGKFEIINKQKTLPLVALRLKDAAFTVFQLSNNAQAKRLDCACIRSSPERPGRRRDADGHQGEFQQRYGGTAL